MAGASAPASSILAALAADAAGSGLGPRAGAAAAGVGVVACASSFGSVIGCAPIRASSFGSVIGAGWAPLRVASFGSVIGAGCAPIRAASAGGSVGSGSRGAWSPSGSLRGTRRCRSSPTWIAWAKRDDALTSARSERELDAEHRGRFLGELDQLDGGIDRRDPLGLRRAGDRNLEPRAHRQDRRARGLDVVGDDLDGIATVDQLEARRDRSRAGRGGGAGGGSRGRGGGGRRRRGGRSGGRGRLRTGNGDRAGDGERRCRRVRGGRDGGRARVSFAMSRVPPTISTRMPHRRPRSPRRGRPAVVDPDVERRHSGCRRDERAGPSRAARSDRLSRIRPSSTVSSSGTSWSRASSACGSKLLSSSDSLMT